MDTLLTLVVHPWPKNFYRMWLFLTVNENTAGGGERQCMVTVVITLHLSLGCHRLKAGEGHLSPHQQAPVTCGRKCAELSTPLPIWQNPVESQNSYVGRRQEMRARKPRCGSALCTYRESSMRLEKPLSSWRQPTTLSARGGLWEGLGKERGGSFAHPPHSIHSPRLKTEVLK